MLESAQGDKAKPKGKEHLSLTTAQHSTAQHSSAESMEDLRGALRLCAQYASFSSGQAHTARTAGAIEWEGFLPTATVNQPPREIPTSSFSSLLDPNARKWDVRAAGTGMLQMEVGSFGGCIRSFSI